MPRCHRPRHHHLHGWPLSFCSAMEAWQCEGGRELLASPGFRELLDSVCSGDSIGSGRASPGSLRHFRNSAIKLHDR